MFTNSTQLETGNRIDDIGFSATKLLINKALRVLFLLLFSIVLFPQFVQAFNDHVIEFSEDYDVQSLEVEDLEESEESEESSWDNSSKNTHCILFMTVLLDPQLLYSNRLLSNQKKIYTPPPESC